MISIVAAATPIFLNGGSCHRILFPSVGLTNNRVLGTNSPSSFVRKNSTLSLGATQVNSRDLGVLKFFAGCNRRNVTPPRALLFSDNEIAYDFCVAILTSGFAFGLLKFWEEIAKRGIFDQKTNRKLVHISIGMAFMLCWPLYSSGRHAMFLAAIAPGVNILRTLLVGHGILKNNAMVKSMSRHGDRRELLKGPLYYTCTITLATLVFWRTSPIAIAAICNLCAGDGVADLVGRKFGKHKLPYNTNKSFIGSFAMALAGFIASAGFMHYFSMFGLMEENWMMVVGFLLVSMATSIVESIPISTELDDNLTVPLTSFVVGCLLF